MLIVILQTCSINFKTVFFSTKIPAAPSWSSRVHLPIRLFGNLRLTLLWSPTSAARTQICPSKLSTGVWCCSVPAIGALTGQWRGSIGASLPVTSSSTWIWATRGRNCRWTPRDPKSSKNMRRVQLPRVVPFNWLHKELHAHWSMRLLVGFVPGELSLVAIGKVQRPEVGDNSTPGLPHPSQFLVFSIYSSVGRDNEKHVSWPTDQQGHRRDEPRLSLLPSTPAVPPSLSLATAHVYSLFSIFSVAREVGPLF